MLLVPLTVVAASTYAEDYFSEDFVTGGAIDEFWPSDFGDPLDVEIDSEEYLQAYVELAAQEEDEKDTSWKDPIVPIGVRRDEPAMIAGPDEFAIPSTSKRIPSTESPVSGQTVESRQIQKRNPAAVSNTLLAFEQLLILVLGDSQSHLELYSTARKCGHEGIEVR